VNSRWIGSKKTASALTPDANALRQARHDNCKRLCACPTCGAPRDEACRTKDYIDPVSLMEATRVAGMGIGKSWASTTVVTHRMLKLAYCKQHIGGLHAARWAAMGDLDVVTKLGEIAVVTNPSE